MPGLQSSARTLRPNEVTLTTRVDETTGWKSHQQFSRIDTVHFLAQHVNEFRIYNTTGGTAPDHLYTIRLIFNFIAKTKKAP